MAAVAPLVPGLSESAAASSPLRCVVSSDEDIGKSELSAAVTAADDDEEASCKE